MKNSRYSFFLGVILALIISAGIVVAAPVLAQNSAVNPAELESFAAQAGFSTSLTLPLLIARLIRTVISLVGIVAVSFILYGGFVWMTAGGNVERVAKAKRIISQSIIGIILVLSSFAIVQFILNSITDATNPSGITSEDSGPGTYPDNGTISLFYVNSVNSQCASALQNLQLQMVFSKPVNASTIQNGVTIIQDGASQPVPGTLTANGSLVAFTPEKNCPAPNADQKCFDPNTTYKLTFNSSVLKSSTGSSLKCTTDYPCTFNFTTGTGIDTKGPTIEMSAPEIGASVYVGENELLQAKTNDDTGVSTVDFFAVSGSSPIYTAGLNFSSEKVLTGEERDNFFSTDTNEEWDTTGYVTNKSYALWASAADCAGNKATAAKISVKVRAASCDNGVQDSDLGETGVDCGGNAASENYCGECEGNQCSQNADCASGQCVGGVCVVSPKIKKVTPGDGAPGNLVTISGEGFGTAGGTIKFLGTQADADIVSVKAYECNGQASWGKKQIIVQVPPSAKDGPIEVTTGANPPEKDTTNDKFGPFVPNFDVNAVKRPGLCLADPAKGIPGSQMGLTGLNLGASQGTSSVFFSSYKAPSYPAWGNEKVTAVVPNASGGQYSVQAFTGDSVCVNSDGTTTQTLCKVDGDCTAQGQTCGVSWCSETLDYCKTDADCGKDDGKCVPVRVGSNNLSFEIVGTTSNTKPVISFIDTGWKACDGGQKNDQACGTDADCPGGSCQAAQTWGPTGQYLTVFGSDFGTGTGTIRFTHEASGDEALGGVVFPAYCSPDFWHNDHVTVKVPGKYSNGNQIQPGSLKLHLVRQDGVASENTDFVFIAGEPGPSVCSVKPVAGPAGTKVEVLGENFGSQKGTVTFHSSQTAQTLLWENTKVTDAVVPAAAQTGPVRLSTQGGFNSNAVNFKVGSCQDDASICAEGTQCCADGSCAIECATGPVQSHYAYRVSTGIIPASPAVVVQCDDKIISPSPWSDWSKPSDVCANSVVTATFTMAMDPTSFTSTSVVVESCANENADGSCGNWQALPPNAGVIVAAETTFVWTPAQLFSPDTLYRVTVKGGEGAGTVKSKDGGSMLEDYSWRFKTATGQDLCEVGGVNVTPAEFVAKSKGEQVDYIAQLLSTTDKCVTVSCNGYSLAWESDFIGAKIKDANPGAGVCTGAAIAEQETNPGVLANIKATVTNAAQSPNDTGKLRIDFTDPTIHSVFPTCSTACINALPWIKFNTDVDVATLSPATVRLYKCNDSICAPSENQLVNFVASIPYNAANKSFSVAFQGANELDANSWYRIVLDGSAILTASGVALSSSGSNFGTPQNQFFTNDYSWKFKTKNSNVSCGIDRVNISPPLANLNYVGQRQEYSAGAFGAPDDCSVDGQALQGASYTWSPWTAQDNPDNYTAANGGTDKDVAFLLANGSIQKTENLPAWCNSACLNTGSTLKHTDPVCGDGVLNAKAEECDDGNIGDNDGCSSKCLLEGSVAPDCGNNVVGAGEQCDDGNVLAGDGCSPTCLNEGSTSVFAVCGDGIVDHVAIKGGEDCDDGNNQSGDGCSANCLYEGSFSQSLVYAVCGNAQVEDGEDCDDGNAVAGDGCSASCLNEGTNQCAFVCSGNGSTCTVNADCPAGQVCQAAASPCCGNGGVAELGEDCDDGNNISGDGCSASCLNEGASAHYNTAAVCGNSVLETAEECEANAAGLKVGGYAIAQIAQNAPLEVNETTGYAISDVTVTAEQKSATGSLRLSCSCTTDASCGEADALGCGTANCCFERPEVHTVSPAAGAGPGGQGYCRNTSVWVDFDQKMDPKSFGQVDTNGDGQITGEEAVANISLVLYFKNGAQVSQAAGNCPTSYIQLAQAPPTGSKFAQAWFWVKTKFLGFFGRDARALGFKCVAPVSFSVSPNAQGGDRVSVKYSEPLEPNSQYRLEIKGDSNELDAVKDGALSQNGVGLCFGGADCAPALHGTKFDVGSEVCTLDAVNVVDLGIVNKPEYVPESLQYFSKKGEQHTFKSTPLTLRAGSVYEEITPMNNIYTWNWTWASSIDDAAPENVVMPPQGEAINTTQTKFESVGNNGQETIISTAEIIKDTVSPQTTVGAQQSGTIDITAFLCENPWPALNSPLGFPYKETAANTNFSFFYCRDDGEDGTTDDLPALLSPVDVTSTAGSGILQELIFQVEGTQDAIGFRVIPNPDYLSAAEWFKQQKFIGQAEPATLDGYDAVQTGKTMYIAAANEFGGKIYPNIYVISYNQDAGVVANEIFKRALLNWKLNANTNVVTDINLCKVGAAFAKDTDGKLISCTWDGACVERCENNFCSVSKTQCQSDNDCALRDAVAPYCFAEKAKLRRDTKRLIGMQHMTRLLDGYGKVNGVCSVTKGQSCSSDANCPGTEKCLKSFPTIQDGTFVPALTNSIWGSWNAALANALSTTLPTDPVNEFWLGCKGVTGYDSASCWNGAEGQFQCPNRSQVYGYQSIGGTSYKLFTQLEYPDATWTEAIDKSPNDEVTVIAEYNNVSNAPGNLKAGFVGVPQFCNASAWGSSEICGDGTKGPNEQCEVGDTSVAACSVNGTAGSVNVTCKNDCSGYLSAAEAIQGGATCTLNACGNGVVEQGETCDDGPLNGSYGHCGSNCDFSDAFSCGDGFLAGNEQCDCGTTLNFSQLPNNSWAKQNNCVSPNGQYSSSFNKSCSYDCKKPGPSCGDKEVNGAEECDGGFQQYNGKLCGDKKTQCVTDSDCAGIANGKCGDTNAYGPDVAACGVSAVCGNYPKAGEACSSNSDCQVDGGPGFCSSGVCAAAADLGLPCNPATGQLKIVPVNCSAGPSACKNITYELTRSRTCGTAGANACQWNSWQLCKGGTEICGNGIKEGTEQCDDGNNSNNDSCTNECKPNICGDDHLYTGVESCDDGSANGTECTAPYGGTCNFCNNLCQYKTKSGAFCGDGTINGGEFCDAASVPKFCQAMQNGKRVVAGTCSTTSDCDQGYTCSTTGLCNGGSKNGQACLSSGECTGGSCVFPTCTANCQSACPHGLKTVNILVQSEVEGAQPTESIELFGYLNKQGDSPDNALLYLPACTIGSKITANVDNSKVEPPDVDVVFVTDLSGSMESAPNGSNAAVPNRRIDIVSAATADAINTLFNAYADKPGNPTMRISLVSYQNEAAKLDMTLSGKASKTQLINAVKAYATNTGGYTPTAKGVEMAISQLSGSPADVKIVVLLSDGEPSYSLNGTSCSNFNWNGTTEAGAKSFSGSSACAAEVRYSQALMKGNADISYYSAVISNSSSLQGLMAHESTEKCTGNNMSLASDCESGSFAFIATTAAEIDAMYKKIVESILGTTVTVTATDNTGTYTTSGQVPVGDNVTLPFPKGFQCNGAPFTVPLRNTFYGSGSMRFSNFEFTYCPQP